MHDCWISKRCRQLVRELVSKSRIGLALTRSWWLLAFDVGIGGNQMSMVMSQGDPIVAQSGHWCDSGLGQRGNSSDDFVLNRKSCGIVAGGYVQYAQGTESFSVRGCRG